MSRCLNRAELIGRLGAAPEIRMLEDGQAMATFSVATSWRWQDANDEAQEVTEWSRCVVFGPLAEYCGDQLQKGTRYMSRAGSARAAGRTRRASGASSTEIVVQRGGCVCWRAAAAQPAGRRPRPGMRRRRRPRPPPMTQRRR